MASGTIKHSWENDMDFVLNSPYYVDIHTATSSNKYHAEYDGYLFFNGVTNHIVTCNLNTPYLALQAEDHAYHVVYVRKGMNIWFGSSISTEIEPPYARFFPIK